MKCGLTREQLAAKVQTEDKLQLTYRVLDLMEREDYVPKNNGDLFLEAISHKLGVQPDHFNYTDLDQAA